MDILLLERIGEDRFLVLAPPPAWTGKLSQTGFKVGSEVSLSEDFLVLDTFFPDAEDLWISGREGTISCDPWIQSDAEGREWPLAARAMHSDGKPLLLLEHLGESYTRQQQIHQLARENMLSKDELELEVHRRTALIRKGEEELAHRLLDVSNWRDEETGAHIRRIGLYSELIAKALGWSLQDLDDIRLAAPMHDIGKVGIPDYVLLKPGRLDTEERRIMERHAFIGGEMLKSSEIRMIEMAHQIAIGHHEKWNGQGYPNQLAGEAIPISARIVAIVDVYDALSSERIYKPAWPEEKVLELLQNERGAHFDPELIDLFFELLPEIRKIRLQLPDEKG
ncbi:HD domain-containing protein [Mariprofundus sp. NF]|nr:HD domain-containing protein [Mariprofundus sp. NF]